MSVNSRFLGFGVAIWPIMPVTAMANGLFRELVLVPALGASVAGVVAVVTFFLLIYPIIFTFLRFVPASFDRTDLWTLGLVWMLLAVAFEFVVFGVVLGVPMSDLLAAYDITRGELWPVVLLGVLIGPPLLGRGRASR